GGDDVRDPWCGTTSTSAASAAPRPSISASEPASMSPVSSTLPPPDVIRSTQDRSLLRRPPSAYAVAAGCTNSKSTPSQLQRAPALQRAEGGARAFAARIGWSRG